MKNIYKTCITFAVLLAVAAVHISAQKAPEKTPKVTKVDEVTVKEILKPNGKPLLVNFWATWCVPCREEFPELVKLDAEYKGKIDFITITLDDPAEINRDVPKFLNEMKATMPTYLLRTLDENAVIGAITKDWQGGLPFTILYDKNGNLTYFRQGIVQTEIIREEINKTLTTEINELPKPKILTTEDGEKDAKEDIAKGFLRIKKYGLGPGNSSNYTDELKKKFGIEIIDYGCFSLNFSPEYIATYNSVMKTEISKRFGKKVLEKLPL